MRAEHAALLLLLAGCAHRHRDPAASARRLLRETADAIHRHDVAAIDARVSPSRQVSTDDRATLLDGQKEELDDYTARLRAAATGRATLLTRVRLTGPLGLGVRLDREEDGWRVDPDSVGLSAATPAAAVELLVLALDRMENDPALVLLTSSLRQSIVTASRERTKALRALLPTLQHADAGRLSLQVDYGQGLFLVLRLEGGAWRIDDFN